MIFALALATGSVGIAGLAAGDEPGGAAVSGGDVVGLERLLPRIREEFRDGRILNVELERELHDGDPLWVYEVKILTPGGNVLKLKYDARTMDLRDVKGRHGPHRHEEDDD